MDINSSGRLRKLVFKTEPEKVILYWYLTLYSGGLSTFEKIKNIVELSLNIEQFDP